MMTRTTTQAERITKIETVQEHQTARLDEGSEQFKAILKMFNELKKEFEEIKASVAELKPIAEVLKNPIILGALALTLIMAGVGLTLSFILGVDVTEQMRHVKEVIK